jgi:hypothetical protein
MARYKQTAKPCTVAAPVRHYAAGNPLRSLQPAIPNVAAESKIVNASDDEEEEYADMNCTKLRKILGNRCLKKSGTKAELISRLEADDATKGATNNARKDLGAELKAATKNSPKKRVIRDIPIVPIVPSLGMTHSDLNGYLLRAFRSEVATMDEDCLSALYFYITTRLSNACATTLKAKCDDLRRGEASVLEVRALFCHYFPNRTGEATKFLFPERNVEAETMDEGNEEEVSVELLSI